LECIEANFAEGKREISRWRTIRHETGQGDDVEGPHIVVANGSPELSNCNGLSIVHVAFARVNGWQWLFALEAALTGLIGIFSWFYLPPSPTQTRKSFRKKGWFSEREEIILVTRILRYEPPDSAHMKNAIPEQCRNDTRPDASCPEPSETIW
jgi:hypothetical protein